MGIPRIRRTDISIGDDGNGNSGIQEGFHRSRCHSGQSRECLSSELSVFEWSKIIQDNKLKYEYLRKKLNHQLSDDPNFAVDYLRAKHAELFPTKEKEDK